MTESKLKILCIEDDKDTCELITYVFKDTGYEVETCGQTDCLNLIHEKKFSAIVLDNYFHGLRGADICREIRNIDQITPIIFLSGEARQSEIAKALAAGANEYLTKPGDFEKLVPVTIKLIAQSRLEPDILKKIA
jgi:DNA-binding response OmpR family regulator